VYSIIEPRPRLFGCDMCHVDYIMPLDKKNKPDLTLGESTIPGGRSLHRWLSKPDSEGTHMWSERQFSYTQNVGGESKYHEALSQFTAKIKVVIDQLGDTTAESLCDLTVAEEALALMDSYSTTITTFRQGLRKGATFSLENHALQVAGFLAQSSRTAISKGLTAVAATFLKCLQSALKVTEVEDSAPLLQQVSDMQMAFREASGKQKLMALISEFQADPAGDPPTSAVPLSETDQPRDRPCITDRIS
jgi:hypothetical protein